MHFQDFLQSIENFTTLSLQNLSFHEHLSQHFLILLFFFKKKKSINYFRKRFRHICLRRS